MSLAKIPIPDRLELGPSATENWKTFKQRWSNYTSLTDLTTEENNRKRKLLLIHCLSDEALRVYNSFNLGEDCSAEDIVTQFESYIIGETNITYERFQLNKRVQKEDETFEQFYSEIQRLIKTCDYCDKCRDSILRDKLVVGVQDADLQKDLLKKRKLTLKNCIDLCRANEKATLQNKDLKPETVNKIGKRQETASPSYSKNKCKFCGKSHKFRKELCPAFGKTCEKCHGNNHFAEVCRSRQQGSSASNSRKATEKSNFAKNKKVHILQTDESGSESECEWIHNIKNYNDSNQINCLMNINNQSVKFQIDSGASVNILPQKYVDSFKPTKTKLRVWNKEQYNPLGESRVIVRNPSNNKKFNVNFIICHDDFTPILGLRASEQMKLIRVNHENFEKVNGISSEFNPVFDREIGTLRGKHSLKIKEGARPVIMPNRKVPVSLKEPFKNELDRLQGLNVIAPVDEPTEWVSQSVLTPKKNGTVRLCLDPQEINKVILREHYCLPTIDDILHELKDSKVFTKADLSAGYWHVELDEESSKLTTFQTCYGRFRWIRLPFGLSVSAEIFQKKILAVFSDLPGVICVADDIIIHGKDANEHDENMSKFLQRCKDEGVALNREKMEHKVTSLTFMGHKITSNGLEVDEEKVRVIKDFPRPSNVPQLRCFLGMVNFVAKFIQNSSKVLHPLNNLLQKGITWNWSDSQEQAFVKIKEEICKSTRLAYYDPKKELILENDASEYGLGSTLIQDGKPIAFASRSLSASEKNYAQIEKEMLAISYGLNKFHHYVYGREVTVHTDHKPLVFIVKKPLSKAPKRLQSMILRNQEYAYTLIYKKGTSIPIADALSRAPVDPSEEVNFISNDSYTVVKNDRLEEIRLATEKDETMEQLKQVISRGWPEDKSSLNPLVTIFFSYRDELTIENGIIFRGERIVIPKSLRSDMKKRVHAGHTGINSCLRRARNYIFWPGMSGEIRQYVESCNTCASLQNKQPPQPLCHHSAPVRPWQKVATDIFTVHSRNYLITVDYFSQFFEVDFLPELTSSTIIQKLKAHFARHGIPETIISDNGGQLVSFEFQSFCKSWNINHKTISPGNSKANGAAEAAVKTAKKMMKKCHISKEDPYIALLNIRNTPQEHTQYSPAQKLMGRNTNTLLPTHPKLLMPAIAVDCKEKHEDNQAKIAQKSFNNKELTPLNIHDSVRMQPIRPTEEVWKPATVVKQMSPRSYIVQTPTGKQFRRDRQHLRARKTLNSKEPTIPPEVTLPETAAPKTPARPQLAAPPPSPQPEVAPQHGISNTSTNSAQVTQSSSGRTIRRPSRYND